MTAETTHRFAKSERLVKAANAAFDCGNCDKNVDSDHLASQRADSIMAGGGITPSCCIKMSLSGD